MARTWTTLARAGYDVYRDLVTTPAFFATLPSVVGLRCLDLGCGEGHNTRLLTRQGAEVVAVDVADTFIRAAVEADDGSVTYVLGDGAQLPFATASFDAVTAFMSLMDVAAPERTLIEIACVPRPGGFTQFSISLSRYLDAHPSMGPRRIWSSRCARRRRLLL